MITHLAFTSGRFDSRLDDSGLARNVSVITEGEAKGHGLFIDAQSIQLTRQLAAKYSDCVPCKIDHGGGIERLVGAVKNFRIDGQQLRGDLQLLQTHSNYATLAEMIRTQPTSFGLSIAFSYVPELIGDKNFIRPTNLYSVDLVLNPAANVGLFSSPSGDRLRITSAFIERFSEADAQRVLRLPDARQVPEMERMLAIPMTPMERVEMEFRRQHKETSSRQQFKADPAIAGLTGTAKTEAIFKQQLEQRKK